MSEYRLENILENFEIFNSLGLSAAPNRFRCDEARFGRTRMEDKNKNDVFDVFHFMGEDAHLSLDFNLDRRHELKITFRVPSANGKHSVYALCLFISEINGPIEIVQKQETLKIVVHAKGSFRIFERRGTRQDATTARETGNKFKRPSWHRRNEIPRAGSLADPTEGPIQLFSNQALFEIGRCNAFQVNCVLDSSGKTAFAKIVNELRNLNVRFETCQLDKYTYRNLAPGAYKKLWENYYRRSRVLGYRSSYLLESAISLGRIEEVHAAGILDYLASIPAATSVEKILEQVVLGDGSLADPMLSIKEMYDRKGWHSLISEKLPDYCVLLQKVVITATSMLILPSSLEMSNRVLRQYATHLDRFLRVQFMDDTKRGRLHGQSPAMSSLFSRVTRTLVNGVYVGGRLFRFLAFGNSQLREHGVFFFSDCNGFEDCKVQGCQGVTARRIREDIGDVSSILIVAKQASRVGQAFSTTRALHKGTESHNIVLLPDQLGGTADKYCFTDGVGMITSDLLEEVSKSMGITSIESCAFQFRLGGAKGVLSRVSPNGLHGAYRDHVLRPMQVFLRKSQTKFQSDHDSIEVVRLALYGSAFLNRQFITTLWSLGVETKVFLELQKAMIQDLDDCMLDEEVALKCLRKYVDETGSSVVLGDLVSFGFLRRGDPFVNHVLRLFRSWSLKQLKEKAKISVTQGCYLMGVADEVGVLRGHHESMYSQDDTDLTRMDLPEIFVQITDPENNSQLKIVQGVCIIGRAPALHPGDMRLVRAVDKPELRYLHNVVVFPTEGDQDIPSMCGGGDLDGDDYTIIWEPSLLPSVGHRYIRCMDYEGPKPKVVAKITLRDVFDFIIDFMKNDSLGQIAFAHLAFAHDPMATRGGIKAKDCRAFSDECMKLAELHSTAVDFGKTGIPASMPATLARTSYPDFMEIPNKDSFVSDTPLSHLYRQVKTSTLSFESSVRYDDTLCDVPNMLEHLDTARIMKKSYDEAIRRLMAQYGIRTEAEVVTGFILDFDAKYSGQREFSMRMDVAHKYAAIKKSIRDQISNLCSTDDQGRPLDKYLAECARESFVAAMYDVTFADTLKEKQVENAMLSFAWVEHEVLGRLSTRRSQAQKEENHGSTADASHTVQ